MSEAPGKPCGGRGRGVGEGRPGGGSSAAPPPTRWGICSAGRISNDFVVALGTLSPEEHRVVAVAARDLPRAQEFARKHRVPRAYGNYRELAEDPDVDVVYVGTVNPQHLPCVLLFVGSGKATLVEKPMGGAAREVREMAAAARERGVFLMEGFWTRFFPAWQRLKQLLDGGALGEPRLLRASLAFPLGGVPRVRDPQLGGGALLDLGGYLLQMATAMLGGGAPPRSIHAHGTLHPTGVDETVAMTLEFPGGAVASLSCSMAAAMPGGAALGGTRGWAEFPSHMNCPTELVFGGQRETFPLPPPSQPLEFSHGTGMRYEAQHVRECLIRGLTQSPVMPLEESEVIAELLDQARAQVGAAGMDPPPKGTPAP